MWVEINSDYVKILCVCGSFSAVINHFYLSRIDLFIHLFTFENGTHFNNVLSSAHGKRQSDLQDAG